MGRGAPARTYGTLIVFVIFLRVGRDSIDGLPVEIDSAVGGYGEDDWDDAVARLNAHGDSAVVRLTSVQLSEFDQILKKFGSTLTQFRSRSGHQFRSLFTCDICIMVAKFIKLIFRFTSNKDTIIRDCIGFCKFFKIEEADVCDSIVPLFSDMIIEVGHNVTLDSNQICGTLFGETCAPTATVMWKIKIPSSPAKPAVKPLKAPPASADRKRILHVSDTHIDFEYMPGADAECERPLCCRRRDGLAADKAAGAGFWGDTRKCDTPSWTFKNLLATLKEQERREGRFDYIYWTGDIPPHDVWNQTKSDQLESIKRVADLINETFPDTPIFPSLGNHEASPVNSYPPNNFDGHHSMSWLYEPLSKRWQQWLPHRYSPKKVKEGAFYSVLVEPGFRIISLNMNYCNNHNFWLLLNLTDPLGQLDWLVDELFKAEAADEKVHILGHIPPGITDCLKSWSWNYYRVIDRFESTITGQFFGHTHFDEMEVFYHEPELKRPTNVAYIAPSVTTFSNLNPGYRVYEVDGLRLNSTRYVLDTSTYILNLTKANADPHKPPIWEKEYSAKEAYNMTTLFPADWHDFVHRMAVDEKLFDDYIRFFYKSLENHARDTREDILCRFVSGRSDDPSLCHQILREFRMAEEEREKSKEGGGSGWFKAGGRPKGKVNKLC